MNSENQHIWSHWLGAEFYNSATVFGKVNIALDVWPWGDRFAGCFDNSLPVISLTDRWSGSEWAGHWNKDRTVRLIMANDCLKHRGGEWQFGFSLKGKNVNAFSVLPVFVFLDHWLKAKHFDCVTVSQSAWTTHRYNNVCVRTHW